GEEYGVAASPREWPRRHLAGPGMIDQADSPGDSLGSQDEWDGEDKCDQADGGVPLWKRQVGKSHGATVAGEPAPWYVGVVPACHHTRAGRGPAEGQRRAGQSGLPRTG